MIQPSSWSTSLPTSKSALHFIIPTPFKPAPPPTSRPVTSLVAAQRASTNCLDGLRGVAAFAVMIFHFSMPIYPTMQQGYGFVRADGVRNESWLSLPLIKVWYSGGFAVFLFFVISGYVLSVGIIRAISSKQQARVLPTLGSLTFRRAARLFIPSIAASLIAFLLHRIGVIGQPPDHHPSAYNDTLFYMQSLRKTFTFYTWSTSWRMWHLAPLWTIPVEFRCSMVLFLLLLALSRCRRQMRFLIEGLMLLDCWVHDRWDVACFILGLIIAELHVRSQTADPSFGSESAATLLSNLESAGPAFRHQRNASQPILAPPDLSSARLCPPTRLRTVGFWGMFVGGLYLGSVPTVGGCATPGFAALCALTFQPEPWQYIMLPGAFLVVTSILFLPTLQRPLNSRPARYLGKVSYAMYLMHELVDTLIAPYVKMAVWGVTGREGGWKHVGYVVVVCVLVAVSLWVADMFMRAVDAPATRLARRMEEFCLEREVGEEGGWGC